jgi:4-hydroxy-3-methylbut-2-enyl diphosphate reductase
MSPLDRSLENIKLNLKVVTDPKAGFCTGVEKAIHTAEEILKKHGELYCIGQIVHNDEEIKRLEKQGLKTIDYHDLGNVNNKKVLFRAHGEPPSSYLDVTANNNEIIDATCPIVLKIQARIKSSSGHNETILIYGNKDHPEVIGLKSQGRDNVIVFNEHNLTEDFISKLPKKISLFSQTTRDKEKYAEITILLKNAGIDVDVNNTICGQVSGRKNIVENFCNNFNIIVFVAGKNSSNGKTLFGYCKAVQPNSYYISSPKELNRSDFKTNDKVGITGGTSTPRWLMEEVCNTLESF